MFGLFLLLAFTASHETQSRRNAASGQSAVLLPAAVGWLGSYTGGTLGKKEKKTLADSAGCTHQASLPQGATDSRPSSDSIRDSLSPRRLRFSFALFICSVGKEKKKKNSWKIAFLFLLVFLYKKK